MRDRQRSWRRSTALDDLVGKRTGERIRILRDRRGLSRPVLAGLVGRSPEWLKGIESGRRLPPRLELLVRLAEALGLDDVAILAGTDMNLGPRASIPVASFARVPLPAAPALSEAVRAPLLNAPDRPVDVVALGGRVAHAWRIWHASRTHRMDVGRILPGLVTDARVAVRLSTGNQRRAANALLADVYTLVQHELAYASGPDLLGIVADRGVAAAQEADLPIPLAGAAWTLASVWRSSGDLDGALEIATEAERLLATRLDGGSAELRAMYGAMQLHASITHAKAGRDGDAHRCHDAAARTVGLLPPGYHHPITQFGASNVAIYGVSIAAKLSKSATARQRARRIDPDTIPSRERRAHLLVDVALTYHQTRDYGAALGWLEHAYAECSDSSVRYSPAARQMVADIVDRGGPMIDRRARAFAQLLGVPV